MAEAETVCSGVTRNTTAKITSQHGLVYSGLIRRFGVERAQMYLNANESALQEYRALCAEINCDFEEKDSFVYSLNGREKIVVATHFPFLNKHGSYFLKLYQHRSYVLTLQHAPELPGMYVDEAQKGMSFRSFRNLLLVGGLNKR